MIARPPLPVPVCALVAFVGLLGLVLGGWTPLHHADTAVSEAFRWYGTSRHDLIAVLRVTTQAGVTWVFLLAGVLGTLLLWQRGERAAAQFCALVTVAVPVLWSLGHLLLYRPRPVDGFVVANSNGFPSGHSSNSAAAALVVVLLLWPRQTRTGRVLTVLLAAAFAAFVGATRIALLVHWPSDVLGGWLLALGVVGLAARVAAPRPTGVPPG